MGYWLTTAVYLKQRMKSADFTSFMKKELNVDAWSDREEVDSFRYSPSDDLVTIDKLYSIYRRLPVDFEMLGDEGNDTSDTGSWYYAPSRDLGIIEREFIYEGTYSMIESYSDKEQLIRNVMEAPTGRRMHRPPLDLYDRTEDLTELDRCALLAGAVSWPKAYSAVRKVQASDAKHTFDIDFRPKKLSSALPLDPGPLACSIIMTTGAAPRILSDRDALIRMGKLTLACVLLNDDQVRSVILQSAKTKPGLISKRGLKMYTWGDFTVDGKVPGLCVKTKDGLTGEIALGQFAPDEHLEDRKKGGVPLDELLAQIDERLVSEGTSLAALVKANVKVKTLQELKAALQELAQRE